MAQAMAHRGPDGWGVWADPDAGLALSHRRLAIIDLTAAGAQPMVSSDGRWAISYNGEVYNARAIAAAAGTGRRQLSRHVRYRSDPRIGGASRARPHARRPQRHVCDRAVGPRQPHAASRARPAGHQAAVLFDRRRPASLCVRAEGAARRRRRPGRDRSGVGRKLSAVRLRAGAVLDPSRRDQGDAGASRLDRCRRGRQHAQLLVAERGGVGGRRRSDRARRRRRPPRLCTTSWPTRCRSR